METPEPVLTVSNLSKTFPGQRALRNVSMEVLPGQIHALLGQNGSGKSTLIKCLSGYQSADPGGEILVGGELLRPGHSHSDAMNAGMCFVHQDLGLVPSLSVLENFCMGRGFETGPVFNIRWGVEAKRVAGLMADFGHDISPWTPVRHLSRADRTIVAVVRALAGVENKGRVLVLDEPTASLPQHEVKRLFAAIRRVAERGMGVIYVSHRLPEVLELADQATILRDGGLVGTFPVAGLTERQLIELIIGRELGAFYPPMTGNIGEDTLLWAKGLSGERLTDASLAIRRGEVVGVAGLLGSGCTELGQLLFGASKRRSGTIWFKGKEVEYSHPRQAMRAGMALVTEDRHRDGSFRLLTVGQNITIADLRPFWKNGWMSGRAEMKEIWRCVRSFDIMPPEPNRRFYSLSGGNQQKAILAKWIRRKPDLLICDEPVVGVDIGAKTAVYRLLEQAAADGAAVLLISSEYKDLENLCRRVLVLNRGRIVAELSGSELTEERIAEAVYSVGDGDGKA